MVLERRGGDGYCGAVVVLALALIWVGGLVVLGLVRPRLARPAFRALVVTSCVGWALGLVLGLRWAPPDEYMGEVQRIMYVHVPLLWTCMLALALNFAASMWWLLLGHRAADELAVAVAEAGVAFGVMGLVTGAIWGKATWGVWWSWDPRMISATAMVTLYAAYLMVRAALGERARLPSAVMAASVSIVLPIVWFSVRWWSSLHQLQSNASTMDPQMRLVLLGNVGAMLGVFACLVWGRLAQRAAVTPPR